MNIFIKTTSAFLLLLTLFVARPVLATEIRLDTHKAEINSGEQFLVDVVIHSEESLNAVEGRLIFPTDKLLVKEIRDGNSAINFWVEKPHIETSGIILFSGITPGGFSGANNIIFSVVFEAKNTGVTSLVLQDTKALLNNGLGTESTLLTHNAAVSIKPGDGNTRKEILTDTELPEDFSPTIESNPNIFAGKYFLVFASQDKISGIANYKVREGRWGWFDEALSPYFLRHQSLDRNIYIKAIDKAGNERTIVLNAQNEMPWYQQYTIFGIILIVIAFSLLLKKLWSRFIK